jgi:cytoskeleton protein RodZ
MRVTNSIDTAATAASARPGPATAGAKLRSAREAAGLSVDAVAQQLKLAPRQVKALEEDDFQRLPGRTFVRGFARNYARFVRLDPEAVLALLPAPESAPALERPALAASRRPMGEIPVERIAKPSGLRWLIPLLIVAALAAVLLYELPGSPLRLLGTRSPGASVAPSSSSGAPAQRAASSRTSALTLPNPISDTAPAAQPVPATTAASAAPARTEPASGEARDASANPATPQRAADVATAASRASASPTGEAPLVLAFRGTSWVEVKDANGRVVVQMTGGAGMTQTVSAVPPLELALGNASEVAVTFRGQPLDLAPYMRGSVARVALK